MNYGAILAVLLVLTVIGFYLGRGRARVAAAGTRTRLHSLPGYYGAHVAIWMALPAFVLFLFWISFQGRDRRRHRLERPAGQGHRAWRDEAKRRRCPPNRNNS